MYMPRFGQLTGLAVLSVILAACGGGASSRLDDTNGNGNSGGGGGNGGGGTGSGNFLNCSALDPRKVYAVGKVGLDEDGGRAIVNLENPREYCVGLHYDDYLANMTITNSGRALYITDTSRSNPENLNEFVQDEFVEISDGFGGYEWDMLDNLRDNDVLVIQTSHGEGSGLFLKQDGSSSYQVYYQTSSIYNDDSDETPYFLNPNGLTLMGVMSDGSFLMYKEFTLYLVDALFNEVALISPDSEAHIFEHTSRVFTDPNTGNQSVWILVHDTEYSNTRRWKIDLVTKIVTDDGVFAAVPDYVDSSHEDRDTNGVYYKLDGDGNLIQSAIYNTNPPGTTRDITNHNYQSLVIKRPIDSSQQPSVILFSDAEYEGNFQWRQEDWPIAHLSPGALVTGQ